MRPRRRSCRSPRDPTPKAPFPEINPLRKRDPLVVDVAGSGIQLTNVRQSNAYFDYGGTGFAERTGWITPTEGILINGTGRDLNSVTADELFGAASGNGFTDLAQLDTNGDGRIDASDAGFANLAIWQDSNGNGIADPGELISLTVAGITAINLNPQQSSQSINGNVVTETSTFIRADGTTSTIAEVNFGLAEEIERGPQAHLCGRSAARGGGRLHRPRSVAARDRHLREGRTRSPGDGRRRHPPGARGLCPIISQAGLTVPEFIALL